MIDNTLKSIEQIASQLKSINAVRKLLTMLLYMGYLIYRLATGAGYLALNIVLLCLSTFYAAFYVYYTSLDRKILSEKSLHLVDSLCRWAKLVLCLVGAGLTVVGFLTVNQEINTINLIFAILLPVFLVLQLVFDLVYEYILYCLRLLKDGIGADIDNLKQTYQRPIQTVAGVRDTMQGWATMRHGMGTMLRAMFGRKKAPHAPAASQPSTPAEALPTEDVPVLPEVAADDGQED